MKGNLFGWCKVANVPKMLLHQVYTMMNVYSLIYYSHVDDSHWVQILFVAKLDCWQDRWEDIVKEGIFKSLVEFFYGDTLTATSSSQVLGVML